MARTRDDTTSALRGLASSLLWPAPGQETETTRKKDGVQGGRPSSHPERALGLPLRAAQPTTPLPTTLPLQNRGLRGRAGKQSARASSPTEASLGTLNFSSEDRALGGGVQG